MRAWVVPPIAGLIEPVPAPEIRIAGIGGIERLDGALLIYLYADQTVLEVPGHPVQKIVAVKIIGPICAVPGAISQLAQCLWPRYEAEPPAPARGPYLVR